MKQELTIAKRRHTVQRRTFGDLRGDIRTVVRAINRNTDNMDPHDWDRLILEVIRNQSKSPIKFKLPKIGIILDEFNKLPVGKIGFIHLTTMYNIALFRQHQGRGSEKRFGSERWLMKDAYGKLLQAVQDKRHEQIVLESSSKPAPQVRVPA